MNLTVFASNMLSLFPPVIKHVKAETVKKFKSNETLFHYFDKNFSGNFS